MAKKDYYTYKSYRSEKDTSTQQNGQKKIGPTLDFLTKEAYNLLRTNVSFSFPQGEGTRIVGVTSPCPKEGKSFTSINLAYSLAEAGYKVILVDADMRRPSVYKNVNRPVSPGLSNLLVGDETNVIHEGVLHENLCMMMAGDIPPNPSELLGSYRMKSTLDLLSKRFDYIIVDLPPVQSVADPLVISKFLDGIVVVVKFNSTKRSDITDTIRQLKFTNVHILGFVFNNHGSGTGYYQRYYRNGYYKKYYRGAYYTSDNMSEVKLDAK